MEFLLSGDLSGLTLHSGPAARILTSVTNVSAMAVGRRILLSAAAWRDLSAGHRRGLELLAHEAVHVMQARRLGFTCFLARYVAEYVRLRWRGWRHASAYRLLAAEIEARQCAAACARLLDRGVLLGFDARREATDGR